MAVGEDCPFGLAAGFINSALAYPGMFLGGCLPWKADRYVLGVYFLRRVSFCSPWNSEAEPGKQVYFGGLPGVWDGAGGQSLFFQSF